MMIDLPMMLYMATPCSQEGGAALGLAAGWIGLSIALGVLVLFVIAVGSGVWIGRRRGAIFKQVSKHVVWTTLILLVVPFIRSIQRHIDNARYDHYIDAYAQWVRPFDALEPGELGSVLDRVMADKNAETGPSRALDWLPEVLNKIEYDPTTTDRTALEALPGRFASALAPHGIDTDVSSTLVRIERLKGSTNWLRFRPDLTHSAEECGDGDACLHGVAKAWSRWCLRNFSRCRTQTPGAMLDMTLARYWHDKDIRFEVDNVRYYMKEDKERQDAAGKRQ